MKKYRIHIAYIILTMPALSTEVGNVRSDFEPKLKTAVRKYRDRLGKGSLTLMCIHLFQRWSTISLFHNDLVESNSESEPLHSVPVSSLGCSICLSEFADSDSQKFLSCFHVFHSQCINTWLIQNPRCPICRVSAQAWAPERWITQAACWYF